MTSYGPHILIIQQRKLNKPLDFLKEIYGSKDLNSVAYKTLVRPQLENIYASIVWCPHHDKDMNKVEAAQRRLKGGQP